MAGGTSKNWSKHNRSRRVASSSVTRWADYGKRTSTQKVDTDEYYLVNCQKELTNIYNAFSEKMNLETGDELTKEDLRKVLHWAATNNIRLCDY